MIKNNLSLVSLINKFNLLMVLLCSCLWSPSLWSQNLANQDPLNFSLIEADIIIETNVLITMRDGINIAVDIYRPANAGQYPTLYGSAPYPHDNDLTPPDTSFTGPVAWYVNQGFTYVLASTRGTGLSEGSYEFLSREEQQDHYEIIEWIAEQEWSNGKVAGIGASYYATAQWQMAVQNPPHLECIAPYNGVLQPYQAWAVPGGLINTDFSQGWYEQQIRQQNAFPGSGLPHIVEYDIDLQLLLHPIYDDYWRLRTSLEKLSEVSVPVFMLRSWDRNEPGLNDSFKALELLNSTHKLLLIKPEDNNISYQDPIFLAQEVLPFYNWCLKGIESSTFIEQPRIRYFVRGQDQTKPESTWPPGNTQATPLFLSRQASEAEHIGNLSFTAQGNNSNISQYGLDTEASSIQFISEILDQDLEITGPVMLELYARSSASDTGFEITLSEQVIFENIRQMQTLPSFLLLNSEKESQALRENINIVVSTGKLKASARSPIEPQVLNPGEVTRFEINLQPTAYRFKQGNRIVINIKKAVDVSLINKPSRESILHSRRYPTRLWLPLVQTVVQGTPTLVVQTELATTRPDSFNRATTLLNDSLSVLVKQATTPSPAFDFLNIESLKQEIQNPVVFIRQ